jgi:hypothetical protein
MRTTTNHLARHAADHRALRHSSREDSAMRTPRRPTRLLVAGLLLLGSGALAGCDGLGSGSDDQRPASGAGRPGHGRSGGASSASDPSGPSASASTGSGSSGSSGSGASSDTVTVPVYFVGDTPAGPRLFREFRRVPAGDPVGAALDLAASGDALDPDYRTLLPQGDFSATGVQATGGTIDIPLPDDSWTRLPSGTTESEALLAVQQIVYTAQGVLQSRTPVTFTDSSGNATQIFGVASEDGFPAANPVRTLGLVNITTPEQGQTVGSTFTASGVASSFEANVPWEVRDSSGTVVLHGAATAEGWMDKLYPWQATVDVSSLSPGTYTFVASTDDPSDGEGAGPTRDTKTITVS